MNVMQMRRGMGGINQIVPVEYLKLDSTHYFTFDAYADEIGGIDIEAVCNLPTSGSRNVLVIGNTTFQQTNGDNWNITIKGTASNPNYGPVTAINRVKFTSANDLNSIVLYTYRTDNTSNVRRKGITPPMSSTHVKLGTMPQNCTGLVKYKLLDVNGNDIFDGIPVRLGNIGYLYDKVTRTLFRNSGVGDFEYGPDIN